MWVKSNIGKPLGWCRKCDYKWTPDKGRSPSREEIEKWRAAQIEVEKEREEAAQRALELLRNEKVWEKFYQQNNQYSRMLFAERGIRESWVDYLQLGLIPDFTVSCREGVEWAEYHSPAISIPVWNVGGVVQNVKIRVTNPRCSADRYRNWYKSGRSYLYVPMYDLPLTGTGIVVEGEFKAVVLEQTLDNPNMRVVGVQSKAPSPEVLHELKDLDPIYVWLDPDAHFKEAKGKESAVDYVSRILGKDRVRVVTCPVKVDDGIVRYGLDVKSYLKNARKP
jgi:hypothetical protein